MMNEDEVLILDKRNRDVTSKIVKHSANTYYVQYRQNEKAYPYNKENLKFIYQPTVLSKSLIRTSHQTLFNVNRALRFSNHYGNYIKVFFESGGNKVYLESDLAIEQNLLDQKKHKIYLLI